MYIKLSEENYAVPDKDKVPYSKIILDAKKWWERMTQAIKDEAILNGYLKDRDLPENIVDWDK